MSYVTICMTHFKSLGMMNLRAALHSVRMQDLTRVARLILVDNNSNETQQELLEVLRDKELSVPAVLRSFKHGDSRKTHSWSTNTAVGFAETPWVFFTRSDYILDFNAVARFVAEAEQRPRGWNGFVTGNFKHLHHPIEECEKTPWRKVGIQPLLDLPGGVTEQYAAIDTGVWLARRDAFNNVGGLDEGLSAWGHAQTHFQYKLFNSGVEFVVTPQISFCHPLHGGERNIDLAHEELRAKGVDVRDMWKRYTGAQPY